MPLKHGQKFYLQLLLDSGRYQLLKAIAEKEGVRVSALARAAVYAYLEKAVTPTEYRCAEAQDRAVWAESVKRRVEGRRQRKGGESRGT